MEDIQIFITEYPKITVGIISFITAICVAIYNKFMRSKYEIGVSRTANIELISKLDAEYARYVSSPPKDGQTLSPELLEERKKEIRFLKQNAYANLLGFTMKLETIERLHKSIDPMLAMDLYAKYSNFFESIGNSDGDIKFKEKHYMFSVTMLVISVVFYFISLIGATFVTLPNNPIMTSVTFGIITSFSLIVSAQ